MAERTRGKSENEAAEIIVPENPSNTLPPEKCGRESGQFHRTFLTDRRFTPIQLRSPQLGGMVLNDLSAWEDLLPEIQNEIRPHMLDFVAKNPIPPDEEITAEIERTSARAETIIKVRNLLAEHKQLPKIIEAAILTHIEEDIAAHPQTPRSETLAQAYELMGKALKKLYNENRDAGGNMAGRYSFIAWEVLNEIDKKQK